MSFEIQNALATQSILQLEVCLRFRQAQPKILVCFTCVFANTHQASFKKILRTATAIIIRKLKYGHVGELPGLLPKGSLGPAAGQSVATVALLVHIFSPPVAGWQSNSCTANKSTQQHTRSYGHRNPSLSMEGCWPGTINALDLHQE